MNFSVEIREREGGFEVCLKTMMFRFTLYSRKREETLEHKKEIYKKKKKIYKKKNGKIAKNQIEDFIWEVRNIISLFQRFKSIKIELNDIIVGVNEDVLDEPDFFAFAGALQTVFPIRYEVSENYWIKFTYKVSAVRFIYVILSIVVKRFVARFRR